MRPLSNFGRVLLVWAGSFALMALAAFVLKMSADYSRLLFGTWFVVGFVLIFGLRLVMSKLLRRWARDGRVERRAVIVGGGKAAETLIRSVEKQPYNDIRICGIFDDRDDKRSPPIVAGYPKLGTISELIEFDRIARIDMLIVSLPVTAETRVLQLLKKLWVLPVDIRLSAHSNALQFRPRAYSYIGSVPMLDIFDKPINDWDSVAKRAFDILFSLIGIVLFSPVMLATAVAIKLDSKGPVLFKQKRHGFNNEVIEVYKFRSMYTDKADPTAKQAVTKNDPRVTPFGRFMRVTHLDELPQVVNILRGDLSVVGPRPEQPHYVKELSEKLPFYDLRHLVRPGLTGWAQVKYGYAGDESDALEKLQYEFFYLRHQDMAFDLRIMLRTVRSVMGSQGRGR